MGKVVEIFPGVSKTPKPEVKKFQEKIYLNVEKYTDLLIELSKILKTIPGNLDCDVYQKNMQMVGTWDDDAINFEINNYDQSELIKKPFFYRAVIDTAKSRELTPSSREQ
ncbi:hypothetical protein KAJ89_01325 [Candidatus Parcubacteria bacterium]|nr:hypothetical protein [Candidatus Parcubacteria bacterium]